MVKKFFLTVFCILFACLSVSASTNAGNFCKNDYIQSHTDELLQKIKDNRDFIYKSLNLTEEQSRKISELDANFYEKLLPDLKGTALLVQKIENIATGEDCSVKRIKSVKKEFRPIEKNMYEVKKAYEKEFRAVLTSSQNSQYKKLKKAQRTVMKQEMKRQIELVKQKQNL